MSPTKQHLRLHDSHGAYIGTFEMEVPDMLFRFFNEDTGVVLVESRFRNAGELLSNSVRCKTVRLDVTRYFEKNRPDCLHSAVNTLNLFLQESLKLATSKGV